MACLFRKECLAMAKTAILHEIQLFSMFLGIKKFDFVLFYEKLGGGFGFCRTGLTGPTGLTSMLWVKK